MLILSKKKREEHKRASEELRRIHLANRNSFSLSDRSFEDVSDESLKLRECLLAHGLGIRNVEKDGNCLFSAVSDQLYEDDKEFETYVSDMRKQGTWAGNLELQAISILYQVNIRIHCEEETFVDIVNFEDSEAKWIHLSYQHGEHYGSVRNAKELQEPITVKPQELTTAFDSTEKGTLVRTLSRSHQVSPTKVANWMSVFKGNVELTNKWLELSVRLQSSANCEVRNEEGGNGLMKEKPYQVRTLSTMIRSKKNGKSRGLSSSVAFR
eukprot:jgi/Galph1/2504/GphlegSOOS_G1169.1